LSLEQVAKLLTVASATDGREVDENTVYAWHDVIRDVDWDIAYEALRAVMRDDTVRGRFYPKDFMRHVDAIQANRTRAQRIVEQAKPKQEWHGDPKPENFEDMARAYNEQRRAQAGDDQQALEEANRRVAYELGRYRQQLLNAGIDPDHPRYNP
jgi:hypothetical protein